MFLILLAAGAGAGYWYYRYYQPPTQAPQPTARHAQSTPQPVGAATVGKSDIRVVVNALGTVAPVATVTVQSQISGQLQEVGFTEGQMVKKGDFLAQVDPRPYQLLEQQFEGQLAHDQGALQQGQIDLARYKKLAEQKAIAGQQYEDQIYIVQQQQGTVKVDQAQIEQQKLNISYAHVVSPITGRIGLRLVDPGNYVQANLTGIAVITQLQPITVVFSVPEDELPQILPQYNAGTQLTVEAYDRGNVHLLATGHVRAIDSQIDTTTGTVKLRAEFDNQGNALFPNQFVNARLIVKTLDNVTSVPVAAIQRGSPGTFVYVINPDETVSVRTVQLGPTDGPIVAVNSGLQVGDRVVVDGADRLRDGAHVTIPAPPQAPATPQSPSSAPPLAPAQPPNPNPAVSNAPTSSIRHPEAGSPTGEQSTVPEHGAQPTKQKVRQHGSHRRAPSKARE